ncbi:alpha-helical pore-forming toxin family protein (plasmid) [Bacillus cereus]|uniref:HBL/NHE enterotoxin family protein n=1 Tax=Bacillus cereus TaxID=1396 RepID=UPI001F25746E|nr:HBL/NHE enterotoxin family protein [Bacillus cereus]UIJ69599.1 alpha-helical pore-forming toxin family protein [Bacillus cereus]
MKKSPYKIISAATIIAAITTGNILPSTHVLAQEQIVQEEPKSTYSLGPTGIKEALAETGSNILVMNLYASTMLKQPNVDLSGINIGAEGEKLIKQIHSDQEMSRVNAKYWMDTAKPKIQKTTRNIVNYNTQFQQYYDTLVDAAKQNKAPELKEGLQDLYNTINLNAKEVSEVIQILQKFKQRLYVDSTQLKNDVSGPDDKGGLTAILAGKDALIPQLQSEIESLRGTQKAHLDNALGWGIGGGLGMFLLLGGAIGGTVAIVVTGGTATPLVVGALGALTAAGVALGTASGVMLSKNLTAYNQISDQIGQLSEQVGAAQQAVVALTNTKATLTELYQTVDQAIVSLTNMKKQWDTMGANYSVLLDSVDSMQPQNTSLLVNDLDAARKEWNDIYQDADSIAKDMGFKVE